MLHLWTQVRNALRGGRGRKAARTFTPAVARLEDRDLLAFSATVTAKPNVLWPPNGRYVPVELTGVFREYTVVTLPKGGPQVQYGELPGPKQGAFQVIDEYRQSQLAGLVNLTDLGGGYFSFHQTIYLQAKRSTQFPQGRRYYISAAAHDSDGWGGQTIPVWVPNQLPPAPKPGAAVPPATATRPAARGRR